MQPVGQPTGLGDRETGSKASGTPASAAAATTRAAWSCARLPSSTTSAASVRWRVSSCSSSTMAMRTPRRRASRGRRARRCRCRWRRAHGVGGDVGAARGGHPKTSSPKASSPTAAPDAPVTQQAQARGDVAADAAGGDPGGAGVAGGRDEGEEVRRPRPCWSRQQPPPTASRADPDGGDPAALTGSARVAPTQVRDGRRPVIVMATTQAPVPAPAAPHARADDGGRARPARRTHRARRGSALWLSLLLVTWWGSPVAASASSAAGAAASVRRPDHRPRRRPCCARPGRADGARAGAGAGLRPGRLARIHRIVGFTSFNLMLAHIVTITWGYAGGSPTSTPRTLWDLVVNYPGMLLATAATVCLVMVVVTSIRAARRRLRYESWHLLHLYAYLGVGLAIPHQLWTGADFTSSTGRQVFWWSAWTPPPAACCSGASGCRCGATCATTSASPPSSPRATAPSRCTSPAARCTACRSRPDSSSPGASAVAPDAAAPTRTRSPRPPTGGPCGSPCRTSATAAPPRPVSTVGSRAWVEGPYGRLSPRARTRHKVLMIGAGVGITPLRALAEGLDVRPGRGARPLPHVVRPDLRRRAPRARAAPRPPRLGTHRTPTGPGLLARQRVDAPTDLAALTSWVPDVAERDVFVCGPGRGPTWSSATSAAPACPSSTSISRTSAGDP